MTLIQQLQARSCYPPVQRTFTSTYILYLLPAMISHRHNKYVPGTYEYVLVALRTEKPHLQVKNCNVTAWKRQISMAFLFTAMPFLMVRCRAVRWCFNEPNWTVRFSLAASDSREEKNSAQHRTSTKVYEYTRTLIFHNPHVDTCTYIFHMKFKEVAAPYCTVHTNSGYMYQSTGKRLPTYHTAVNYKLVNHSYSYTWYNSPWE